MDDLVTWLNELGFDHEKDLFLKNNINIESLDQLTDQSLRSWGLSARRSRRLLAAIEDLKKSNGSDFEDVNHIESHRQEDLALAAERRQVTVMFCDLVGSTLLASSLDPEDFADVINAYRDTATKCIDRFGGFVGRYAGDGIPAYFGYPTTHEDDPQRALRAGLAIIEAMDDLNEEVGKTIDHRLAVRIGIATGDVLAGNVSGSVQSEDNAVIGETPNLAARIQTLARPDTIVISGETRDLAGSAFEYEDLGLQDLKGIASPPHAWLVTSEKTGHTRFDARRQTPTPFVGRLEDLEFLEMAWGKARGGNGQTVILNGEPGIGKSRLVDAFVEKTIGTPGAECRHVMLQCDLLFDNTSLHPLLRHVEGCADFQTGEPNARKLTKLRALLSRSVPHHEEHFDLLTDSLGLVQDGYDLIAEQHPNRRRKTLLTILADLLIAGTQDHPLLLVLEDVQWADPSTREFFKHFTELIRDEPVFALITARPNGTHAWLSGDHVSVRTLGRVGQRDAATIVGAIASEASLPQTLVETIYEKTDGCPLFIEEFTKALIDSGQLSREDGQGTPLDDGLSLPIPDTIYGPLRSRIDQLGPARKVAQVASVIGREFTIDVLRAASEQSTSRLLRHLRRLTDSGLVVQKEDGDGDLYVFKHALIQEATYQSLLKRSRKKLHLAVAIALEDIRDRNDGAASELLARHYSLGGATSQAIRHWRRAAERAFARSGQVEAANLLQKALGELGNLGSAGKRAALEQELTSELAAAMRSTHGYAAPRVEELYATARRICAETGENRKRFNVEWGLMQCMFVKGDLEKAGNIAEGMFEYARMHPDVPMIDAQLANGMVCFHRGDFVEARRFLEEGAGLGRPEVDSPHFFSHGQNPGIFCRSNLAQTLWFLGFADQAREIVDENLAIARSRAKKSSHVYSYVNALIFAVRVYQCRRDAAAVRDLTTELIALASRHHYAYYEAIATVRQGWALCAEHGDARGIGQMEAGMAALKKTRAVLGLRSCHLQLAQIHAESGNHEDALDALSLSKGQDGRGTRVWDAEIERLRGSILADSDPARPEDAEVCFRASLDTAGRQKALALELRTCVSYSKFLHGLDRDDEARELLGNCIGRFDEGFDSSDWIEARKLKNNLNI